ncbi:PD-(D/E)XK nuclease family protein [Acinetobacter oleivorans]|uniref:PD-(D/E)XK nuclease family protein n=1 Tax=Acinetobacter oleivorans TaxID=1148157 RepID=UPI00178CE7D9|nr:PD-(D/E)XK nuclease family protein [Acinetobacter oleivorans]MBE2174113.1 PD-(D/E)XK nuclease family protein [Acinetobacter oleivorans]
MQLSIFEHYKQLLKNAKKYKIPPREKTFFDTAIRNHYENPTTELLEFFLNPTESHDLGDLFWKGFCDVLQQEESLSKLDLGNIVKLEREYATHQGNRIDLWIETDTCFILLEAKIYHHQNNPFQDYIQFAQSKNQSKNKQIVGVILSIAGKSEKKGWLGLSYQQIVNSIRPYLAEQMLANPMNKWNLFAREFLLHLDSYYRIKNLDMNRVQFILDHYKEIEELQRLRTSTISEVVDSLSQQLNEMIDGYESENKYESWGGIRFYNKAWGNKSNTTLLIKQEDGQTVIKVITYILNLSLELEEEAFSILGTQTDSRYLDQKVENYRRGTERWLCIYWRSPENNLTAITDLLFEKVKLLDTIERTLK